MTYRAAPVTQRDGSPLANSNCRMAAAATGIDYHTAGDVTSSGADMRAAQSDQSGGTDSGDAAEAWDRGYGQQLRIMDGNTFSDVIADLGASRLVMLDVWHAAVGGPCLSGSGAYGHTMAVAPERSGSRWLVADPWCSPPTWQWVEESRLRAGAEEWGRRVAAATGGGYPRWSSPTFRARLAATAKAMMSERHPGNVDELAEPPAAPTRGPVPVMYTTTRIPEVGHDMAINTRGLILTSDHAVTLPDGTRVLEYPDGQAPEIGRFSGPVDYFGATGSFKAVRVDPGSGSVIGYTSTAATAWEKPPEPPADELAVRQAQYDADAAAVLGPRPG